MQTIYKNGKLTSHPFCPPSISVGGRTNSPSTGIEEKNLNIMRRGKSKKPYNKNRNKGGKRKTKNLSTYYVSRGGIRL